MRRRGAGGFTLIEIGIAVAVIGVLAAIAIPSYMSYRKRAKTAEPINNLATLYIGAASYYDMQFTYADADAGTVTQATRCVAATSAQVPATPGRNRQYPDFDSDSTFKALKFTVPDGVNYSYLVTGVDEPAEQCTRPASTEAYTFAAFGDLDGDAELSTFSFQAGVNANLGLARSPGLDVTKELE